MDASINAHLTSLLINLGFTPSHHGFGYMREMIKISYRKNETKLSNIYIQLSQIFGQLPCAIQTAVRTALKTAQNRDGFNYINRIMGTNVTTDYPLTPMEFLCIITEYLRYFWDGSIGTDADSQPNTLLNRRNLLRQN